MTPAPDGTIASYVEGHLQARVPEPMRVELRPSKLKQRMEHYKIELPRSQPVFDRVFVYPLDDKDQPDTTAGGIVLAEQTKAKLGAQRGVLVMAGPKAVEQLYSHGISIGDIVWCARLSPWDRHYFSATRRWHRVLVLRSSEIVSSEDLDEALTTGDLFMEMSGDGRVQLNGRERVDPPENDEGT